LLAEVSEHLSPLIDNKKSGKSRRRGQAHGVYRIQQGIWSC